MGAGVQTMAAATAAYLAGDGVVWNRMAAFMHRDQVLFVSLGFLFIATVTLRSSAVERARVRASTLLYAFAVFLLLLSEVLRWTPMAVSSTAVRFAGLMIGGIAIVNLLSLLLFDVVLPLVRLHTPRILRDLLVALGYIGVAFWLLSNVAGMSLSGIVTTSAILTAVIGFSLQDTLGNIMGGLALQMERTIDTGDWVRVGQVEGRVKEIRWRHTSIETRNWDTVVIPNSVLMKSEVTILGRRFGQPMQHRMWVYFNVDFRISPTEVIAAV